MQTRIKATLMANGTTRYEPQKKGLLWWHALDDKWYSDYRDISKAQEEIDVFLSTNSHYQPVGKSYYIKYP